ncbi:MAG: substrate-binding domain-containing protein [Fuerstia sp.]|nr:substrate-binding domain-containing protein [Fuerstiella sp.]
MFFRVQLIVAFLCLASLMGCSDNSGSGTSTTSGSSPEKSAETKPKKGTIGFSTLTLTNPFFKIIADSMTEDAKKHGYEVVVVSGDQDVNRQTAQIEDFIVKGVSAIVLNPCDSKAIGTAIRKANDAGIPVFTNDIKYDGTEGRVECHIATDNYQGGRLAGEAMVRLIGESGGKVAVLHYPDVESCQLRVKGFTEVIDAHNAKEGTAKIEIATTLNGQGAREAGFAVAKDAIESHPDLAAIFAINDLSAIGAHSALEAAGKADQVRIIGFDGTLEGKQAILAGKIVCDPIQFPDKMGKTTIEMIVKYFDGEKPPAEILIESSLYYQEDAKKDPELATPAK